jgi:DNA primase
MVAPAWLHGVAALMGSSCSIEQAALLTSCAERLWIMGDGDEAGQKFVDRVWRAAGSAAHCRQVTMEEGKQPTDLTGEELAAILPLP